MPTLTEDVEEELNGVTRPDDEISRSRRILENADVFMQDLSCNLIVGEVHEVDHLTKWVLDKGVSQPPFETIDSSLTCQ